MVVMVAVCETFYTFYTAKFYIMNQNWNRVDFRSVYSNLMKLLGMSLTPNCEPDLYQFYKNSPQTFGLIQF